MEDTPKIPESEGGSSVSEPKDSSEEEPRVEVVDTLQTPSVDISPLESRREQAATWLAYGLLIVFALTILLPLGYWIVKGKPEGEVLTYVKDVATNQIALLGVAFGFYFSQRRLGGS